jgi:hypothetical protein
MQQEIVNRKGDWVVPEIPILDGHQEIAQHQTTSAVDRAIQSLAGTRGREIDLPEPKQDLDEFIRGAQQHMTEEEPSFDACAGDVTEPSGDQPVKVSKRVRPPSTPQMGNTPAPRGGIIIGDGSRPTQRTSEVPDPWAPKKPVGRVVKPGAQIQFGTSDEGDD